MSLVRRHPLWALVAAGLGVRLVLAFAFYGTPVIDVLAFVSVEGQTGDLEGVYEEGGFLAWPYPPPYIGWVLVADGLADALGLSFHGVVQLLPILADVGIALAVYWYLRSAGASERQQIAGAGLVLLGPSFIAVSGYQGQIDSVAILPAVIAVIAWQFRTLRGRAVESGLLVGLGAAIKTVPGLVALPLLSCARSVREGVRLTVAAAVLPVAALLPLYLAGISLTRITEYGGVAAFGGLSLVLDPGAGWERIADGAGLVDLNGASQAAADESRWITATVLLALTAFLFRYRPAAIDGTVLLWLAVFSFSPNFFLSYLVWSLPFFIMAGYLRGTAILQAALLPATVIYYLAIGERVHEPALGAMYVGSMLALWAFWVLALAVVGRRIVRARDAHPAGVQPPLARMAVEHG